ncbi:MAG: NADH-ubiquinone oxidoreductase-F iron-sulfur binding region domain-containing protein [Planctomycetota bacterium]|jgi:NADH:ubiquinone oxidoreductase subunit F (NADH-binding)
MDLSPLEGLRGCGGAGFPASFKWKAVREEPLVGAPDSGGGKVVVCNADEGEPGTFKDGWILREQPEVMLRGMQRAAAYCGAARGYVYLRPEYAEQLATLRQAIDTLVSEGLLSPGSGAVWSGTGFAGRPVVAHDTGLTDVELSALDWFVEHGAQGLQGEVTENGGLATGHASGAGRAHPLPPRVCEKVEPAAANGHAFRVDICIGGGAYICGEETALLESMEGRRPQPRHKPPFPTQSGLWGLPTLMNNVETFWWAERLLAGEASDGGGLRLYSLSGDVNRPGVYEAPVGIRASELIERYGGGTVDDAQVGCWIPGGAATGVLPGSLIDTPLSPEGLKEVGTAPGTAAVVVYSEQTDPRSVAARIMRFFAQESCTQCTPCRLGCRAGAEWLEGSTPFPDADTEARWLEAMELGSICGLGFTAPLVMRQWRRYFADQGIAV